MRTSLKRRVDDEVPGRALALALGVARPTRTRATLCRGQRQACDQLCGRDKETQTHLIAAFVTDVVMTHLFVERDPETATHGLTELGARDVRALAQAFLVAGTADGFVVVALEECFLKSQLATEV